MNQEDTTKLLESIAGSLATIAEAAEVLDTSGLDRLAETVREDDQGRPEIGITGGIDTWQQNR